jgi:hypothetical protein
LYFLQRDGDVSTSGERRLYRDGESIRLRGTLRGQNLTVSDVQIQLPNSPEPVKLVGEFTLPLVPDGLPVQGHAVTTFSVPQVDSPVDAELDWQDNQGQLVMIARESGEPLLDLPWQITPEQFSISDGRWNWTQSGIPLGGRLGLRIENWQQGIDKAIISGRMNVLTSGDAGKGNAVLNFGPGTLSLDNSNMPLQLNGEAKQGDLILYAGLPATLTGSLSDPKLAFAPGALLRSRGRIINSLNIDEVRWPLAGVTLTSKGIDGRLQAILRAHENEMGDFTLHLDGQASDFLPDKGLWQWRYWGEGHFIPMHARWDVAGKGEWRDTVIALNALSTGFDKLQYGTMLASKPRMVLDSPVRWQRDPADPHFSGALSFDAAETTFTGGSVLPASTLKFSVDGTEPTFFQFKGDLHADAIGPVQVNGRWDGERLRGQAWWPKQSLSVFQPLIPPDWKMKLREGELYAQVAFSAAADQGFEAGGHGVLKNGSVLMPDNEISGVDFVLPFRFSEGTWSLGTHGPDPRSVDGSGGNFSAIIKDMHGAARHARAGEQRRIVVGCLTIRQIADVARHVVGNSGDGRNIRRRDIHHHAPGIRAGADVALRVGGNGGPGVGAFAQCGTRRKGPDTAAVGGHRAHQRAAFIDGDAAVGFRGTGKGWGGVVGAGTVGDVANARLHIIGSAGDRRRGGESVNNNHKRRRATAFVSGRIGGGDGQAMAAIDQAIGKRRGNAPVPRQAHRGGAQHRGAVVQRDGITRRAGAIHGWAVVVGRLSAGDGARHWPYVVNHRANGRRRRRHRVDGHAGRRGERAGVAPHGGRHGKAVRAIRQFAAVRHMPRPGAVRCHHGGYRRCAPVEINGDRAANNRGAVQGWRRVI